MMSKIGLRTLKSAMAVFCCAMLSFILQLIDGNLAENWFSPFFASIAACYSLHPDRKSSWRMAKTRTIGTIIGGIIGIIVIMIFSDLKDISNFYMFVYYVIVSLSIILVIEIALYLKQQPAVFVTIITFTSISLGSHTLSDFQFGLNRIVSTVIGIIISLLINIAHFPHRKDDSKLFICGLNDCLLDENDSISGVVKYKLNNLLSNGINLVFSTTRSEASLQKIFSEININNPIIVMNGAALYDMKNRVYHHVYNLTLEEKYIIDNLLIDNKVFAFKYVVDSIQSKLNVFYHNLTNEGHEYLVSTQSNKYFTNFVRGDVLNEEYICQYRLIDTYENIMMFKELVDNHAGLNISTIVYEVRGLTGYYNLHINSVNAMNDHQVNNLSFSNKDIVAFVSKTRDMNVVNKAKVVYATTKSDEIIKNSACEILDNSLDVVLKIQQIYYKK